MPPRLSTEERRSEIIAAALRLAHDGSPAAITTRDLAAAVGLSQGALFKHFPNKDAIWLAVMQRVQGELMDLLDEAAAAAASPLDALTAMFRAHVGFVIDHAGVPRLIFHELQQPNDSAIKQAVRAVMQGYLQRLQRVLQQARHQQQLAEDLDLDAAALAFVGMVQGLVMQSMLRGHPSTLRAQAERVLLLYLRGLGAPR